MPHLLGMVVGALSLFSQDPAASDPASPPIFQPGAPGQPTRTLTAAEAVSMGRTTFTEGDVRFMQHMIVHHAQAVEMVALLETRGASPVVQALGRRIALSQEAEMALMREWLTVRGQPLEMSGMGSGDHAAHGAHAGHDMAGHDMAGHAMADDRPLMPGMLSPAQMRTLAAASGAEFDRLFLEGMIQHHRGALDMVDDLMSQPDSANDPVLSGFAASVVADQSAEILRMQSVLSDLSPPS